MATTLDAARARRRRWAAVSLAAAVAACGGAPAGDPATVVPSEAVERARSPWEAELAAVAPDGTRSLESSLRLFSMAFGPLPRVDAPADPGPVLSGSPAIRAIHAHLEGLTDEQRAAVESYLEVPSDALRIDVPEEAGTSTGMGGTGGRAVAAIAAPGPKARGGLRMGQRGDLPLAAPAVAAADQSFVNAVAGVITEGRAALARKWTDFPGGVPVFIGDESYASLSWYQASGAGADFQCRIHISGEGVAAGISTLRFSLYHELFHCAQASRTTSDVDRVPSWVWEGGARYFAQDTIGFDGDPAWIDYVTRPDTSLFARGYDAIGFWGHLRYSLGADVYLSLEAALGDGTNEERFSVVGAEDPAFIDTWASGLASMVTPYGRAWQTDGPGYTPALSAPRDVLHVGRDDVLLIDQAAYSNRLYALDADVDQVRIELEGHGRLGDGTIDTTELASALFCVTDRGCKPCPDDPPLPRIDEVSLLAISGGRDGTRGSVSGEVIDKECTTPSPPPTPDDDGDDDEFCRRYKALVAWTVQNADIELTQPWAAEIARRSADLRPYAPDELVDEVDLFVRVYDAYAEVAEPFNVPSVGPDAAGLADAVFATHSYCDIPLR